MPSARLMPIPENATTQPKFFGTGPGADSAAVDELEFSARGDCIGKGSSKRAEAGQRASCSKRVRRIRRNGSGPFAVTVPTRGGSRGRRRSGSLGRANRAVELVLQLRAPQPEFIKLLV